MRHLKYIFAGLLLFCTGPLWGQSAKQEIFGTIEKSGSVYYAYPCNDPEYTPAPKGYEPFYISHYGRHGSRWLLHDNQYLDVKKVFDDAAEAGALSDLGRDVHDRVDLVCRDGLGRVGELTPLGAQQHRGIAGRMYRNYPKVFAGKDKEVNAVSTTLFRTALSMAAFCTELKGCCPTLGVYMDASGDITRQLNFFSAGVNPHLSREYKDWVSKDPERSPWKKDFDAWKSGLVDPDRLVGTLFSDNGYVEESVDGLKLMTDLYYMNADMQNVDLDVSFYDLFEEEELYNLWQTKNYEFYLTRGPAPQNGNLSLQYSTVLLENFLDHAENAIATGSPAADLRFGHDGNVMTFTHLLQFDGCHTAETDPDKVADIWTDFRISPMASNIQWVFYRKKGSDDILVKFLHNEKETGIPLETDVYPYYHWNDVVKHFRARIEEVEAPAHKARRLGSGR